MRLLALLPGLATLAALVHAESVFINNHLSTPIWYTQVTGDGSRTSTTKIEPYGSSTLPQTDQYGVAIKITAEEYDIDIAGKGVLTLGYNKHPQGWIYYDIGIYLSYPFDGKRTKLGGPGGDNDWWDGHAHPQNTIGSPRPGDLWLDIGY
ncbi:hypothetical protein BU23DRAFT_565054 [Bimuria novae-zelandiae CBS 107.79]|uniref:Uncharacterized protein n=1 Tax=Bimuria novae-zelandiae CBS 107.79 TaxID=1447943 RepID=A0A6A5VKY6_9PLEO|nr:hypothetical protein BU23DRAFT_565054 [Bimuria novae-zelandiae CBS 107.79]